MSSRHAYTDSEEDEPVKASTSRSPSAARAAVAEGKRASHASLPSPKAGTVKPSSGDHRIRLTFRPSLNHLVDPTPAAPSALPNSERSSLSPPPPITLKLGRNPAYSGSQSQANTPPMAQSRPMGFSSDEDEPPAKKARKGSDGRKKGRASSHGSSLDAGSTAGAVAGPGASTTVPAAHRKSYDWLQPAAAGSSHAAPERKPDERQRESVPNITPLPALSGWAPGDEESDVETASAADAAISEALGIDPPGSSPAPEAGEVPRSDKKPSAKKRRKGEAGPGKAWRKGLKKGMAIPWKEGGTFMADGSIAYSGSMSREGSPATSEAVTPKPEPIPTPSGPREPTPPFVLAEPSHLGFPIFKKPIIPPKVTLGSFPKVTQFFAPVNGGDMGKFPRKEKVRTWKMAERTLQGIGGGVLKFKTWYRGPPSELGRLIQADKEAKEIARQRQKALAAAAVDANAAAANSVPASMPPFSTNSSFQSTAPSVMRDEAAEEGASDVGDGEESVAGSLAEERKSGAVPVKGRGKGRTAAKPRKSKLAQEISMEPVGSETSSVVAE